MASISDISGTGRARKSKLRLRVAALTTATVTLLAAGSVMAHADPAAKEPRESRPRFMNVEVKPGARASLHVSKDQIKKARRLSQSSRLKGLSADEVLAEKRAIVKAAEGSGGRGLSVDDVDVFQLNDGSVTVAAPSDVSVDTVDVSLQDQAITVTSTSSAVSEDGIAAGGPGMAPHWANNGDGQYTIRVKESSSGRTLGTATFLWRRQKLASDGSSKYDWFMYARKAVAQPSAISGDFDPKVKLLRVQSYPFDNIESRTLNWTNIDPASNFTGDCSGNTYVEIETPIVSAGYNFRDCDDYKVWHNPDNPGSYWIEMNQGSWISHGGSMEAAYSIGWKAKNGTPGSMHDVNKVQFFWHGDPWTCTSTDAGKTCSGSGN